MYFANVRRAGRLFRESLRTADLQFARRGLHDLKQRLKRTNPRFGKITLIEWLERNYLPTLRGSPGTLAAKRRIIERVGKWPLARHPMRDLRESQVVTFLNEQFGQWSPSYWNSALTLIRDALNMAVRDRVLMGKLRGPSQMATKEATDSINTLVRTVPSDHCRCTSATVQS